MPHPARAPWLRPRGLQRRAMRWPPRACRGRGPGSGRGCAPRPGPGLCIGPGLRATGFLRFATGFAARPRSGWRWCGAVAGSGRGRAQRRGRKTRRCGRRWRFARAAAGRFAGPRRHSARPPRPTCFRPCGTAPKRRSSAVRAPPAGPGLAGWWRFSGRWCRPGWRRAGRSGRSGCARCRPGCGGRAPGRGLRSAGPPGSTAQWLRPPVGPARRRRFCWTARWPLAGRRSWRGRSGCCSSQAVRRWPRARGAGPGPHPGARGRVAARWGRWLRLARVRWTGWC